MTLGLEKGTKYNHKETAKSQSVSKIKIVLNLENILLQLKHNKFEQSSLQVITPVLLVIL